MGQSRREDGGVGELNATIPEQAETLEWYCPQCDAYLCNEQVTFEETHQKCGTPCEVR